MNIIQNHIASINDAMPLFAGRKTDEIAGIILEMTGAEPKIQMRVLAGDAMAKAERPMTTKMKYNKNDVIISGIFHGKNGELYINGNSKLADYIGQSDALTMIAAEALPTLIDPVTDKSASSLLLWGPSTTTIMFMKGRWKVLEDKKNGYGYHVFGINQKTGEIHAFRSVQGRKNAIVTGIMKNGKLDWLIRSEAPDYFFEGVSKIIPTKEGFLAHVTTKDAMTVPVTIPRVGSVKFGKPIQWKGQILAPWFKDVSGTWAAGIFTGDRNELRFTPKTEVKDREILNYINAAVR